MAATVHSYRGGFRIALRDLQRFHIFLITLYQKLDGLLKTFFNFMYKCSHEYAREDGGTSDPPLC
jgi:atypical dual specificity phosphatase